MAESGLFSSAGDDFLLSGAGEVRVATPTASVYQHSNDPSNLNLLEDQFIAHLICGIDSESLVKLESSEYPTAEYSSSGTNQLTVGRTVQNANPIDVSDALLEGSEAGSLMGSETFMSINGQGPQPMQTSATSRSESMPHQQPQPYIIPLKPLPGTRPTRLQISGAGIEDGYLIGTVRCFITPIEKLTSQQSLQSQEVRVGEHLRLVRSSGHGGPDRKSIRIDSLRNSPQGYLPPEITIWMNPLLESGKVCFTAVNRGTAIVEVNVFIRQRHISKPTAATLKERTAWENLRMTLQQSHSPGPIHEQLHFSPHSVSLNSSFAVSRNANDSTLFPVKRPFSSSSLSRFPSIEHDHSELSLEVSSAQQVAAASLLSPQEQAAQEAADAMVLRLFETLRDPSTSKMEEMEAPNSLILKLRPYQKQGLAWLMARELTHAERGKAMKLPPPWVEYRTSAGKKFFFNPETKQRSWGFPMPVQDHASDGAGPAVRGGLLCDEMGMGKTIEILVLMLANPLSTNSSPPTIPCLPLAPFAPLAADKEGAPTFNKEEEEYFSPCNSTLIVCPLSVLTQWADELRNHTKEGTFSLYIYHGSSRTEDPFLLAEHDIVLTTYHTLIAEGVFALSDGKRRRGNRECAPLYQVPWLRLVLDEAHTIKDRNTFTARAAFAVPAERRWCVTGTPIQNKLDDLFSLLHFLRVEPCGDWNWWNHWIIRPIRSNDDRGFTRLRTILSCILLRRTKDMRIDDVPILSLPPRVITIRRDILSDEETTLYKALWTSSKQTFAGFLQQGTVLRNYAHILELLLRLRQCCNHPQLVTRKRKMARAPDLAANIIQYRTDCQARNVDDRLDSPAATTTLGPRLLAMLGESWEDEECLFCLETIDNPVVTICGHLFCRPCIEKHLGADKLVEFSELNERDVFRKCPICSTPLTVADLFPLHIRDPGTPPTSSLEQKDESSPEKTPSHAVSSEWKSSSKLDALMQELADLDEDSHLYLPVTKSIVFSQWTSMLDLVEVPLRRAQIGFVRLDGTMSQQRREKALRQFASDPLIRVFLVSMKAGGLGLNLTAASRVFLLDPWWNPATEAQAVDRVHRLGQVRPVVVSRFVIRNTIEERIVELQEKKVLLAQGALGLKSKEIRQFRLEELRLLFRD